MKSMLLAIAVSLAWPFAAHAQYYGGGYRGASVVSRAAVAYRGPNYAYSASRVTVFRQFGGGYLGYQPSYYAGVVPYFGYGYGYPQVLIAPPVYVSAQPTEPQDALPPPPRIVPPKAMPGVPAGVFRPINPRDRDVVRQPAGPEALPPPKPQADPPVEPGELLRAGRSAFATGEYGRAGEFFQRAVAIAPRSSEALFLLTQARFAQGKFADAVVLIHRGLEVAQAWPNEGRPLSDLYGERLLDYLEHRRRLDETSAANPEDASLLYLRGYVRWFDGRRADATILFRQARERVANAAPVDAFLRAGPGG